MNQEQLNAIKERVVKATQGPWDIEPLAGISTNETTIWMDTDDYIQVHGCSIIQSTNDALFILHAIEDVPALITEVARLREIVEEFIEYCATTNDVRPLMEIVTDARQALAGEAK
ncbi:hypothetical protein C3943_02140 [Lysinibacillus sp. B2A1]|nr:hypothetical protein C3943_02140 [Lysinibacillus sp. B2A1]